MSNDIRTLIDQINKGQVRGLDRARAVGRRKARSRRANRFLKRRALSADDNMLPLRNIMDNEKIFLGVSDLDDLITSELMTRRVAANLQTLQRETTVLANRTTWKTWTEEFFGQNGVYLLQQTSSGAGVIIQLDRNNYITYSADSNSVTVRVYGDADFVDGIISAVEGKFSIVTSYIEWIYSSDGNSVNVPLNRDRLPVEEMYPFLKGETLASYYDRYMASSANILLLIGPPGTGKTTFIRGLLAHHNCSAIVTYDAQILEKDGFFARFIEDESSVMVLEDSDAFLKSRSDGNTMMHRFLNVGDGLVTTKGKKMVFSTNLPSIRDIDSALIRPGRCFDIVTFAPLEVNEAQDLAVKLNVELPVRPRGKETNKYSIAEVFHAQQTNAETVATNRKVGFI
jgi:hypothetical protein